MLELFLYMATLDSMFLWAAFQDTAMVVWHGRLGHRHEHGAERPGVDKNLPQVHVFFYLFFLNFFGK
jgi:hypothetical protein